MKGKVRTFFKRKGISIFLVLVLFMAFALYGMYEYGTRAEASGEHIHDMSAECGQESAVAFTEWTEADKLPDMAGSYFLSGDVTLTETWALSSGTTNLCLNGHQIKLEAGDDKPESIVRLQGGVVLNLCDCSAGGEGSINGEGGSFAGIYVEQGAVFNMYGGQIKGNNGLPLPNLNSWSKGGGIHLESGEVHLYGGSITENAATYGGGIYAVSGKIVMHSEKAVISDNQSVRQSNGSSYGWGGGIYLEESAFCLEAGEISGNAAGESGGGICAEKNSEVEIKNGTISNNTAQQGGGVYAKGGKALLLGGGTILENEAHEGGGLYLYQNDITMSDGKVSGNICSSMSGSSGGGIKVMQGRFTMSGGEVSGNSSKHTAGGVHVYDGSSFLISGGSIKENKALENYGGGVLASSRGTVEVSGNAKIQDNEAPWYGGGIYEEDGTVTITGGEISGNKVLNNDGVWANGGGIYVHGGTFILSGSPVIKNNTRGGLTNNLYLNTDRKITMGGSLGNADSANLIGVAMRSPGIFTSGWETNMSGQKTEDFFVSDETVYEVGLKEGEGLLGYRLTYRKPADASGTVPEAIMYAPEESVQIAENTLTKKGYSPVGWSETEGGSSLVSSSITIKKSMTLYPVFSRNFTGENKKLDMRAGEAVSPVDLNQLVSFDEGVTETEKDFDFAVSGTGSLPEGLRLENGILSGTPEKDGEFVVTITIQDQAAHGQSKTLTLTLDIEKGDEKQPGTASVSIKDYSCGESPSPVPVSATNGTDHVTYFYKTASAADTEYTEEAPTVAGEYIVRAVFAETNSYAEVTAEAGFAVTHKYGTAWETNADAHWHVCVCGAKEGEAAHSEDAGTVTKVPSGTEPGEKTFKCSICGRILRTEEIPVVNAGSLEKEIRKGDNVPDISVPVSLEELADIVLTQEEQESVEQGVDIKIILSVTDAEKLVSDTEKEMVQKALNNFEEGQYLDISLFKQIDGVQSRIVKTNGKIRIVMEIPENLRGENADKRTFAMIRVHDGRAEWLPDLDHDGNRLTIETDCFSTYVLVYQDEPDDDKPDDDKPDNSKPDDDKPDDDKPDNSKPDDNKPDNSKPDDNKPDNSKPDDNKPDNDKEDNEKSDGNATGTDEKNISSGADGSKENQAAAVQKSGTVKGDNAVKTDDSAKTGFWIAVAILSGTACSLLYFGIRKRTEN